MLADVQLLLGVEARLLRLGISIYHYRLRVKQESNYVIVFVIVSILEAVNEDISMEQLANTQAIESSLPPLHAQACFLLPCSPLASHSS